MAVTGRPKSRKDSPARQSRPRSVRANVDKTGSKTADPPSAAATANKSSEAKRKSSALLQGLVAPNLQKDSATPKLSGAALKRVRAAVGEGLDVNDLAALVAYQLEVAKLEYFSGRLEAKDFMIALNKIGSQVAAAAQLGGGGTDVAKITVTFSGAGPKSSRPEAVAAARPVDPVVGDLIPCE